MSGSGFRKNVQAILQTTPDNTEATRLVVQLLKDHGVSLRASWARSMLEPGLSGIRERSLGDTRLEALELCRFLVTDLGVDLISTGVVSGDRKVLARLPAAPGARRPGMP